MKCLRSPLFERKNNRPLLLKRRKRIYLRIRRFHLRLVRETVFECRAVAQFTEIVETLLGNHFRLEGFQHEVPQVQ